MGVARLVQKRGLFRNLLFDFPALRDIDAHPITHGLPSNKMRRPVRKKGSTRLSLVTKPASTHASPFVKDSSIFRQ